LLPERFKSLSRQEVVEKVQMLKNQVEMNM
jgi:hypothetical protein